MALNNNDIFKKLRVALQLRDDEIVKICALVDFKITTTELGALFRSENHEKYMECGDQILRNFLNGLVIHLRGPMPEKALEGNKRPTIVKQEPEKSTRKLDRAKNYSKQKETPQRDRNAPMKVFSTKEKEAEPIKIGNKTFKRRD